MNSDDIFRQVVELLNVASIKIGTIEIRDVDGKIIDINDSNIAEIKLSDDQGVLMVSIRYSSVGEFDILDSNGKILLTFSLSENIVVHIAKFVTSEFLK